MKDYQEALKLGKVLVAYARVMMIGPGGVGKTSFLRGLMNQSLPRDAESTILADTKTVKPQLWAKAGESADSYWVEVTDQDEIEELAALFQLVLSETNLAVPSETNLAAWLLLKLAEFLSKVVYVDEFKPQSVQTIGHESVSYIKDNAVQNVLQQVAAHAVYHPQNRAAPQSEVLMHVWDCGGQPVFLDILPAFLTSRTMFLLFFDARQNLHEECKTLSHKEGKVVSKSDLSFTTLQLLTQWMASIHTMYMQRNYTNLEPFTTLSKDESPATQGRTAHTSDAVHGHKISARKQYNSGEDIIPKFPCILPVGTHGDDLTVQQNEEILSTLYSNCEDKAYAPLLLDGVIVDNTTAGLGKEGEDKGFKYIRERVHQFASKYLAVQTPVAWVLFRKVLQKVAKGSPIVSYEQAVAVGQACGISKDVVPSVLDFYHELAVFLHYTQIESLSNKVIVDPQWLIRQFGRLLAPEGLEQKVSNPMLWKPLHEKGILVQPLYEEVWEESNLKYNVPPQSLVDLLEHFLLLAPLDPIDPMKLPKSVTPYKGKKYFIPTALKLSMQDTDSTPKSREPVKKSSPLHLTFSTQYVPPGFFTRLATTLSGKPKCEPLFERGFCRNKITFAYDQIDEFTICEQSSSVQINVVRIQHCQSHKIMTFGNTCCDIKELIQACSTIVSQWVPSIEVKPSFLCEQCPDFITIPHGADTGLNVYCKAHHHCNFTREKQYWLKVPSTPEHLAQKGDLRDAELQAVAHDVQRSGKLRELADELEMVPQLESLQHDVNPPLTLLRRWRHEIKNGVEAHSLLVHHLKCIGLTGTSDSLYYREFLLPSRTNQSADNKGAARGSGYAHEIVASVDNTSPKTRGTEPTLRELLRFTCIDGRVINIPVEIATCKYVQFGTFLLNDRNGSRVKIMARRNHYDAEQINTEILQEWLNGRGKQPVTWATLVEVLRDIELSTLAGDIEAVKCPGIATPRDQNSASDAAIPHLLSSVLKGNSEVKEQLAYCRDPLSVSLDTATTFDSNYSSLDTWIKEMEESLTRPEAMRGVPAEVEKQLEQLEHIQELAFINQYQITEQKSLDKLTLSKSLTLTRMKELRFDCNGGNFHSPEDDYHLTVPKAAIPEKLGLISMQCGVIPYGPFGPFKYPDGVKPVSPIVWFCSTPSVKFQKPVEITIPHCYDCDSEEDSQSLAFFKANHNVSDSDPPTFHFLKETEGVSSFPLNTSHGTLHSNHLCFYCIGSQDKEITDRANFCLIMAEPKCFQRRSKIHFCLTYLLKTCMQAVEEQFADADYDLTVRRKVKFQSTTRDADPAIEIKFESQLPNGWCIIRKSGRKIYAKEVYFWDYDQIELELMHTKKIYPPRFILEVHGENATYNEVALVEFEGVHQDLSAQIFLSLPTTVANKQSPDPTNAICRATNPQQQQPFHSPSGQFAKERQAANKQSPDPTNAICRADKPTMRNLLKFPGKHGNINIPEQIGKEYTTFGTFLLEDDSGTIISGIESAKTQTATEINRTILREWINGKGQEPFTWDSLVKCLRDADLNRLADDIEEVLIYDSSHIH